MTTGLHSFGKWLGTGKTAAIVFFLAFLEPGCATGARERERDFSKYFGGLNGAFVLFDNSTNTYVRYHPEQCKRRFSPASTFKIPNSLIGLETGVIPDQHFIIPWDSVQRGVSEWNRDHDLQSAIKYSVVWYYQELARRVGSVRMKSYLEQMDYGNMDNSGSVDAFWLGSTLLISADEQILFLKKLYESTLPFSRRSMDIVKQIIVLEKTDRYILRGKTGMTDFPGGMFVGWFVGYLERDGNVYFFATNIFTDNTERDFERIKTGRKEMTQSILRELGLM
jgi:beta-lactamase class D